MDFIAGLWSFAESSWIYGFEFFITKSQERLIQTMLAITIPSLLVYLGVRAQLQKAGQKVTDSVGRLETANTEQHGGVRELVQSIEERTVRMERNQDELFVTVNTLIKTQRVPVFRSTADGRLLSCNSEALRLTGLSFHDLAEPDAMQKIIHPDDFPAVQANWTEAISTGEEREPMRYRYVHPVSGAITEVDSTVSPLKGSDGKVREWLSIVMPHDVSSTALMDLVKLLSQQVEGQHVTLSAIMATHDKPMFRTDPFGALTYCNAAAVKLLGMSVVELDGNGWVQAVHPDDRVKVFREWSKCVKTKEEFGPLSYRYMNPHTGQVTSVEAVATPVVERGEIISWIATVSPTSLS